MRVFDAVTRDALPSNWVVQLHLLRHGHVETGGQRLAYGQLDLPLSPRGRREQADLMDHATARIPRPDRILSSDLGRCAGLARDLGRRWDKKVEFSPALREQRMGDWEGLAWSQLTLTHEARVRAYWSDYVSSRPPGGESLRDLDARVQGWVSLEAPALRDRRVVLITHIGVIRVLLCRALGLPLEQALRFTPARGSHSHLQLAEAGACVEVLGERPPPRARATAEERPLRLALSGSAGTGKSTLGVRLAAELDLPFLHEGMRRRIEGGLSLHRLDHAELRGLVQELWAEQVEAEERALAEHGGFVADRSSVDYAAFWLHYRFLEDAAATASFLERTLAHQERYDRIILLPWGVLPLEEDGVRYADRWVQRLYQATLEGLLHRECPTERLLVLPPLEDLDARLKHVHACLGR